MPVPETAALLKVKVPALPPMELLVRFKSTVLLALAVVMALSAVTLIGLGTGAELAVREAVVVKVPPDKFNVPVPSPKVEEPVRLMEPLLMVVEPL
jgi:hypothetical protein